jgi:hypothetical protein
MMGISQSEGIRYVPAAQEAPERDVREHDVNFLAGLEIGDRFLAAARFEDQPARPAPGVVASDAPIEQVKVIARPPLTRSSRWGSIG